MTTVIDYAWAQISAQWIKDQGFVGVQRYISHDPTKDLTPIERDNLRALDLSIGLVYEGPANAAAQGFAQGVADAQYANQRANSLGYPLVCTLWYAVDFNGSVAQVQPYFDGIDSVAGRLFAPYGSFAICDGVRCSGTPWQTVAWSSGKVSLRAGLLQNGFHQNYDSNAVLKTNYGQWTTDQPQPVPAIPLSRGRFVEPGNEDN